MSKKVGILFGMERSFPLTLAQEITRRSGGDVVGEPVRVGHLQVDRRPPYDVVVDRISHEVPFYRTMLKQLVIQGAQVINNPFWWSADDKYFGCLVAMRADVAIPKTVLLPHKDHPEGTRDDSFSNLIFPLKWEEMFGLWTRCISARCPVPALCCGTWNGWRYYAAPRVRCLAGMPPAA